MLPPCFVHAHGCESAFFAREMQDNHHLAALSAFEIQSNAPKVQNSDGISMSTLTERLAARAKQTATEKGRGRAAFLALKPEIQVALIEGWNAKEIWTLLKAEEKIGISYSVFLRYIREYIGKFEPGGFVGTTNHQVGSQNLDTDVQPETAPRSNKQTGNDLSPNSQVKPASGTPGNFTLASQPDKGKLV